MSTWRSKHRSKWPEYHIWKGMLWRCLNPQARDYKNYGGRGILVCERWLHSLDNFVSDVGLRLNPRDTIEREDTNGNYEPGNCRWASMREQQNNKRNNVVLIIRGEALTASEWARKIGVRPNLIRDRIRRGWPADRALTVPAGRQGNRKQVAA